MPESLDRPNGVPSKAKDAFRDYAAPARAGVREFYRDNHRQQTWALGQAKRAQFLPLGRGEMSLHEAIDFLNQLIDDSDPDTEIDQLGHLLQTSEAIRRDGHEAWFVLAGFLHDLGKVLCLFGEPQWAVVGDTFPLGCAFDESIVYPEFFALNPDASDPRFNTRLGVYSEGVGLRHVQLSWGHDEYLYHVLEPYLPEPALYMIRYHSFYAWHARGAYDYLCDAHDRAMLPWVQRFNAYDLYTKGRPRPDWNALEPYYADLFARFLPARLQF